MKKIRVLVADDHPVFRDGLIANLSAKSDIEVVGQAVDGIEALSLAQQTRPDVILLDLKMPGQDGLTTIPLLRESVPDANILVLTSYAANEDIVRAVKVGALGYLLKDTTGEQLLTAIHEVARGNAPFQPSVARTLVQEVSQPSGGSPTGIKFTKREMDTIRLIGCGKSNKEIALELCVDERTVAKNVSRVLRKTNLENRVQIALFAVREGFVDPRRMGSESPPLL